MEDDFFDGLQVELTDEQIKENDELNKKSEPIYNYVSAALGADSGFIWEFAPGLFQNLMMAPEEARASLEWLNNQGLIIPVPGLSHKKYGRLFIVAKSLKQRNKIQKRLLKLRHIFPKKWKTAKGDLPLID